MSRLAANPAASPSLSPQTAETAISRLMTRYFGEKWTSCWVEKAPATTGWTFPVYEELWNYGVPQEMRHFAAAIRGLEAPQSTGEDGKVVLEAVYAGYASAGLGCRVKLPYKPTCERPIDEWLNRGQRPF